jgi:multiple sugar transport system permease protein
MAFPFFYLAKLSLQPGADVRELPIRFLPSELQFENYVTVVIEYPVLQQFWNTIIYSTTTTVLTVLTGALAAYALAKLELPGGRAITLFFIATMLLPPPMRAVPMYTLMAQFGWVDTWRGMILPLASTGFAIFFLFQFMITIPSELLDAARIDGASENAILWKIIIPLSKTAMGTMALYNFLFRWRGFIWPLVMTKGRVTTLSVGLAAFKTGEHLIPWNLVGTTAMFLFLPSLVLFLGLRPYIMQAVTTEFK